MQYVVVNGSPLDGLLISGPFASTEDATDWADTEVYSKDWWVGQLEPINNVSLQSFYAGWEPPKIEKMHMDLGKARDDLGDAEAEIRRQNTLLGAATAEVDRLLRQNEEMVKKFYDRNNQRAVLEAEIVRLKTLCGDTNASLVSAVNSLKKVSDRLSDPDFT